MHASSKSDFTEAYLYVADVDESAKIVKGQQEVSFASRISVGK